MSLNKFTPIAMKCNKEQWEDIKPLLAKDNILTRHITSFNDNTWLTNNYISIKLNISNISICSASFFKRKLYDEWNKNIFLEACGIETETSFIVDKWYKVTYDISRNVYIKYKKTSKCGSKIEGETITDGLYRKYDYWSAGDFIKEALNTGPLVDLTEIQEYLPDNHVDKFKSEFVLPEKWHVIVTKDNIKYFKSLPNYTHLNLGTYTSITSIDNGWDTINLPKDYQEITFEQFKKYILKQDNMSTINIDKRFPFYLDPRNAQRIIDIACSTWKPKLAFMWAQNMVLGKSIEISEEFYKEMRNACTVEQHTLFNSIFGKDVEDFPYKIGNWITIDGVVVKIIEINKDSSHIYWVKHTPNANTGGGFSFKCYKNRIRFATSEEIAKAICPYKDGELIWIKTNGVWLLRYSNGKITSSGDAEVYYNQLKDGSVTRWPIHRKAEGITLPE